MTSVLFVVSAADHWTLNDGSLHPTGYWAEELAEPHRLFTEAGWAITIATPKGVAPTVDEGSLAAGATGGEERSAEVRSYLDSIPAKRGSGFMRPAYAPPALQAVKRDFAFTVPAGLTADALTRAVKGADKAAITAARVFDVFEREGVRSMAVEVTLQPTDKSFTDADLKAIAERVVAAVTKLGASLRG